MKHDYPNLRPRCCFDALTHIPFQVMKDLGATERVEHFSERNSEWVKKALREHVSARVCSKKCYRKRSRLSSPEGGAGENL